MVKITVCVGSACHLRGAHGVLKAFIALVDKYKVDACVEIEGHFCQGYCTQGVVVTINDEVITNVSRDKVYDIFSNKVLELCE